MLSFAIPKFGAQPFGLELQFSEAAARRFPSRPGGMAFSPTVLDPSQAPAGKHTAFTWQLTSFHLPWDREKERFGLT